MIKVLLSLLAWVSLIFGAMAQPQPAVFHGRPDTAEPIDMGPYTYFYEDKSGDTLPLSLIQQKTFRPFAEKRNERTSRSDRSLMVTWLNFKISNTHLSDTLNFYFFPGVASLVDLYQDNKLVRKAGTIKPPSPELPSRLMVPIIIYPGKSHTFWVRTVNYIMSPTPIYSKLFTEKASLTFLMKENTYVPPYFMVMGILAGCLLFMSLYALYYYFIGRDKTFLYYALYVSSCFLQAFHSIDSRFGIGWLYPYLPASGLPLSPALTFAFYLLFIRQILKPDLQHPVMKKILGAILIILLLQQLIITLEFFLGKLLFESSVYYTYMLVPSLVTILLLLVLIAKSRNQVKNYLLTGSLSLILLCLVPLVTNFYVHNLPPRIEIFVNMVAFWVFLGLTIECFCFALALAYRSRLTELERNRLQQNYTSQVEQELAVRTREIEEKNRELEAGRIRQLEAAFEQKLTETETTALRAQMNPHFIFNCLNSIKFFALQNDGKAAAQYLTSFSKLIRLVLENSRSEKVVLSNELEALELYLQMEAMRFNHKLSYQIKVEKEVDTTFIEIPPLLIQPYVENAIWHGLMHKTEGGKVTVQVNHATADRLLITITDNGIGRAKAAELKSKSATRHKSFGMKMTSERIGLINQLYQLQTQVQVQDLVDAQGEPCGTEVLISIPI
jgi:sensor histidine kinase YesM